MDYDTALFIQSLKQQAPFKLVTRDQIAIAFWSASQDLEAAIIKHKPEVLEEAKSKVRNELVGGRAFDAVILANGFRIKD